MTDVDTGSLGPSGRFARMEASLDRIELKLDMKADSSRVAELEGRQTALETLMRDMSSGQVTSPLGQLYLNRFTEMEHAIEKLETADSNRQAVVLATEKSNDKRYNVMLWIVGIATVFNIAFGFWSAAFT